MDANTELLDYTYQNASMGVDTIDQLVELVEDKEFLNQLKDQFREYQEIRNEAIRMLNQHGHEEKDISAFAKLGTYMSISMKTLTDRSTSHIAQMMMQGSTMGITEAARNIKKYEDVADKDVLDLIKRLLKTEENNFETLKKYV